MMKKYLLAGTLILAIVLSGCNRPYQSAASNVTPSPTGMFGNQSVSGTMAAMMTAGAAQAQGTPQTPNLTAAAQTGTSVANGTPLTPQTQITFTSTPQIGGQTPVVAATTAVPPAGTTPQPAATTAVAPTAVVGRPGTYILQPGEFPYCIARRFNVDPDALLALSGLSDGVIYSAGTVLKIPSSGSFPGSRALRTHPAPYTVGTSDETIYSIACLFGDVTPEAIAQTNGLAVSATSLPVGKQLNIP